MVVLSPQYGENTDVFSSFPVDGLHTWDMLLVIPLEFQEIKHQPLALPCFQSEYILVLKQINFNIWLHSMWLFHLHRTVNIQPFSPAFPLAEFMAEAFCWLFACSFKEKGINHFL